MEMVKKHHAVLLSSDEITLALFGQHCGDRHDDYVERAQRYLFHKSLEILAQGIPVVLDWGFWTKEKRRAARVFYESRGIQCEFHYIDVSNDVWHRNIAIRNQAVRDGKTDAYYVDEGLMKKLQSLFEAPDKDEIDVWHINDWQ
jgi:predicted kinase